MQLDRVVLLGRTFEEYRSYFLLDPERLRGRRVLDVAGGVSSFSAEANALGIRATACDPIYNWPVEKIEAQTGPDLEHIYKIVEGLTTYRWDYYRDRDHMRALRSQAAARFLEDVHANPDHYVPGELPNLPFQDRSFDLTLVSYFLFVYQEQLSYELHRDSILELMRVTRDELRIYPTVTFEAEKSLYLPRLYDDPALAGFVFEEVRTDFEFLLNSNSFLSVRHR